MNNKLILSKDTISLKDFLKKVNENDQWEIIKPILKDWKSQYSYKNVNWVKFYPIAKYNPHKYKNVWISYYLCLAHENLKYKEIKNLWENELYILEVWKKFDTWEDIFLEWDFNFMNLYKYKDKYILNIKETNNSYIITYDKSYNTNKYIYTIYFEEFHNEDLSFSIKEKKSFISNKKLNIEDLKKILGK